MSVQDDNQLVKEVLSCRISSYELLIDKYQKPVFNLIVKMVGDEDQAKDLTQDVFIKVYDKLGSFNFRNKFFSWVYRIAINDTINYLRSRKQFERLTVLNEFNAEQPVKDYGEEQRTKLHQALRELRADHRGIILLKYFFSLSYEDIGEVMSIQEKTVKARLFMAREKLRISLVDTNFFDND
jgi:RNA polymerase sigma-70 factor, ECF subfamily